MRATRVPARWPPLIREALDIRQGQQVSRYPLRIVWAVDTAWFLRFIIKTCNAGLG